MLPVITVEGRLTAEPELRFTPSGAAVCSFTVAANDRVKKGDTWEDGDALFLRCSVWRQQAENVAESVSRGDLVIVVGKLKQRSFETKEGEKRTVIELDAFSVAPALSFATAKVTRASRGGSGGSSSGAASADPWGSTGGSGTAGFSDEPPFAHRTPIMDRDLADG